MNDDLDDTTPMDREGHGPEGGAGDRPSDGTAAPQPVSLSSPGLRGKILGHYRLVEEIGHGGQGFVYLANDLKLRRDVALKILASGPLLSASARLRFEREAETAGRLDHPGIARVIELGEHEGIHYIAMELVKGKTLSKLISETCERVRPHEAATEVHIDFEESEDEKPSRSTKERESPSGSADRDAIMGAVRFIESAARALHVAHEAGLVHRDIKPGNLMVREDGSACVLDFGLAQDDLTDGLTLTQSGDLMGTPAYMSPEQLLAHRLKLDRRTDVYSLGVCLFEACTLERPFKGKSQQDLYHAISQTEPPSPRRINAKVPKDLAAIVLTAIDKNRDRRYLTAQALADDLRRFNCFEPVEARPAGAVVKAARWVQRNPVVAALSAAVFMALLSAAIVFYVKGEEARHERDRANNESRLKGVALADYSRLADSKLLETAPAIADALYPPSPDLVPRLEDWLQTFGRIAERLQSHRAFLQDLRRKALPRTDSAQDFEFGEKALQFKHDVMAPFLSRLEVFATDDKSPLKSVAKRLEQSKAIASMTLDNEMAERWSACHERIKNNDKYSGLDLAPQLGLIPLGPDPESSLEEFLHWLTHEGEIPVRDAKTSKIAVTEKLGIVLVLIPGGTFLMGSQNDEPAAPNYDPESKPEEQPVKEVTLAPYFLSKYEMTRAQWERVRSIWPTMFNPAASVSHPTDREWEERSGLKPVQWVTWGDVQLLLPRIALLLPTEAEWERAARAGRTDQIYSGCSEDADLGRFANVVDSYRLPVGSFLPNAYGLHDMSGNVAEWCELGEDDCKDPTRRRGLRHGFGEPYFAGLRGGSSDVPAAHARVASRSYVNNADLRHYSIGLRPARIISD